MRRPLTYVNVHGEPVDVRPGYWPAPAKKPPGLKRVQDRSKAKQSLGFEVVGVAEAALKAAQLQHADRLKATPEHKRQGVPAFEPEAWLKKVKPKRALSRVFSTPEAAEIAAGMVRAGGGGLAVRRRRRDPEGVTAC